jgi:hypothetical protein
MTTTRTAASVPVGAGLTEKTGGPLWKSGKIVKIRGLTDFSIAPPGTHPLQSSCQDAPKAFK